MRNVSFEYEDKIVLDFLVDAKVYQFIQNSMIDNMNRYMINVLLHSKLVTDQADKERVVLI